MEKEKMTAIKKCVNGNCDHEFQNSRYGKGRRVRNKMAKVKEKPQQYRCTVCETVQE